MNYQIDPKTVVRKDEAIIFDPRNFVVHKLNENGMRIIAEIFSDTRTVPDLSGILPDLSQDDISGFLSAGVEAGFITVS